MKMTEKTHHAELNSVVDIYPNMARIALFLGMVDGYLVWEMRRFAESHTGHASASVQALFEACRPRLGFIRTAPQMDEIIEKYEGVFWHATANNNVIFYGQEKLFAKLDPLLKDAARDDYFIHLMNTPGTLPRQKLDVSLPLPSIKSRIYALWINAHEAIKISNIRQSKLFNVTVHTLRRWRDRENIGVTYDEHHVDRESWEKAAEPEAVFPHRHVYPIKNGFRYQGVNSYFGTDETKSPTQGRRKRVRSAINSHLRMQPDFKRQSGKQQYFEGHDEWQRHYKRHGETGQESVYKRFTTRKITVTRNGKPAVKWVRARVFDRHIIEVENFAHVENTTSKGSNEGFENFAPPNTPRDGVHDANAKTDDLDDSKTHVDIHTPTHAQPTHAPVHAHPDTHLHDPSPVKTRALRKASGDTVTRGLSGVNRQTVRQSKPSPGRNRQQVKPETVSTGISGQTVTRHPSPWDAGTIGSLTPSRLRVHPSGAIFWQAVNPEPSHGRQYFKPQSEIVSMPAFVESVTCERGETWLCVRDAKRVDRDALMAACPDLNKTRYEQAVSEDHHAEAVRYFQKFTRSIQGVTHARV